MIKELLKILQKKEIDVIDYNRFIALEKEMKSDFEKIQYEDLSEAFEIRLPEIAAKVGSYSFIKDDV
jgi:hypothetical protein